MRWEFYIRIATDSAAFEDGRNAELARLLRVIASKLDDDKGAGVVWDVNGANVGSFGFDDD